MMGAQKVNDKSKPKAVMGASGKVVVGMAPPVQGKSKSALRREKAKQKKQEEESRRALEEKVLTKPAEATEAPAPVAPVDPEKRARKIKKVLKQIDDLKSKDPSSLNDDQKKKIDSETELRDELAKLGL